MFVFLLYHIMIGLYKGLPDQFSVIIFHTSIGQLVRCPGSKSKSYRGLGGL